MALNFQMSKAFESSQKGLTLIQLFLFGFPTNVDIGQMGQDVILNIGRLPIQNLL